MRSAFVDWLLFATLLSMMETAYLNLIYYEITDLPFALASTICIILFNIFILPAILYFPKYIVRKVTIRYQQYKINKSYQQYTSVA